MERTRHTRRAALGPAAALALAAGAGGCAPGPQRLADWDERARVSTNAWAVRTAFRNQVEAGVVRRRTIYNDHFVAGTSTLNPRGRQEVEVIARHLAEHGGGDLFFESDGGDEALYALRADAIRRAAASEGLSPDELTIVDGTNTGESWPSPDAARRWAQPSVDEPYDIHGGAGGGLGGGGQ